MKSVLKCAGKYKMRHNRWHFTITVSLMSALWNRRWNLGKESSNFNVAILKCAVNYKVRHVGMSDD